MQTGLGTCISFSSPVAASINWVALIYEKIYALAGFEKIFIFRMYYLHVVVMIMTVGSRSACGRAH